MIDKLKEDIKRAWNHDSKLSADVLKMEGMSSNKNRHFLNNVCDFEGCRYLEIGTWAGSTYVSALYKNKPEYHCAIDNWSLFGGPKNKFFESCKKFGIIPNFIEGDSFNIGKEQMKNIKDINVYFYDGDHSQDAQSSALTYYIDNMASEFIFIVDDWNWIPVQEGTKDAIKKLDLKIQYTEEIFTPDNGDREGWWNGTGIFLLSK